MKKNVYSIYKYAAQDLDFCLVPNPKSSAGNFGVLGERVAEINFSYIPSHSCQILVTILKLRWNCESNTGAQ